MLTQTEWQLDLLLAQNLKNFSWIKDKFKIRVGSDISGIPADCCSSTWMLYYGTEKAGSLEPRTRLSI